MRRNTGRRYLSRSNLSRRTDYRSEYFTDDVTDRTTNDDVPLSVVSVDMLLLGNKIDHHTTHYVSHLLIVRRGQEFFVAVTFNRPLYSTDDFQLEFLIGTHPSVSKGSMIVMPFSERPGSSWKGRVVMQNDATVTLGITPVADALVGIYQCYVAIIVPNGILRTKRDPITDTYVLFNAWCPEDEVFMSDEAERIEYVLNDCGIIYQGSFTNVTSKTWLYGQFEKGVLDACIYILDVSQMPIDNRGSAVIVTRKASAMVNSEDDDGVLDGKWDGDYSKGTAPSLWTGSAKILLQYATTRNSVSYGQCWVFAGVFNTFLRALGIPSRVITNYRSAHDNGGSLETDIIFSLDGQPDEANTTDSVWNFHCWNEVYLSRADLPEGLGGWQVVDATPQESSDGFHRCGPASVKAIKEGLLCHPFDSVFVFAEVNSDVVYYKRDKYGTLTALAVDKTYVGKLTLTKSVGSNQPADITDTYKYSEGSTEDEIVMVRAEKFGCKRHQFVIQSTEMEAVIQVDSVQLGQDFSLSIDFINHASSEYNIQANLTGSVVFYTGALSGTFKSHSFEVTVAPFKTERVVISVLAAEYMPQLQSRMMMNFTLSGQTTDGKNITAVKDLTLQVPSLDIQVGGPPHLGQNMYCAVSFTNPFPYPLENISMSMEGPGFMSYKTKNFSGAAPNETIQWVESFMPMRVGTGRISASLACSKLRHVNGALDVNIQPFLTTKSPSHLPLNHQ